MITSYEIVKALRCLRDSGHISARCYLSVFAKSVNYLSFDDHLRHNPLSPQLEALVKQQIIINRLES